jgi:hypothetical protein
MDNSQFGRRESADRFVHSAEHRPETCGQTGSGGGGGIPRLRREPEARAAWAQVRLRRRTPSPQHPVEFGSPLPAFQGKLSPPRLAVGFILLLVSQLPWTPTLGRPHLATIMLFKPSSDVAAGTDVALAGPFASQNVDVKHVGSPRVAEEEGFEPPSPISQASRFQGGPVQPLRHSSAQHYKRGLRPDQAGGWQPLGLRRTRMRQGALSGSNGVE